MIRRLAIQVPGTSESIRNHSPSESQLGPWSDRHGASEDVDSDDDSDHDPSRGTVPLAGLRVRLCRLCAARDRDRFRFKLAADWSKVFRHKDLSGMENGQSGQHPDGYGGPGKSESP